MPGASIARPQIGRLGEIAEVIMGQSPLGSSYNRERHGVPLINGPTEFTDRCPIPKQWTTAPVRFCKPNDVLICVRGSSTGRTNTADQVYCIGRGVAAIRAAGKNDQTYVRYALAAVVAELLKLQAGSTFPSIDARVIRGGEILVPAPGEQKRIGMGLLDADDRIAALERLITKKQAIKQGMMQELLTGRTRLPGFAGSWSTVELGDLAEIVSGGTPSSGVHAYWDGGIPWATPTDITNESGRYLRRTERTISKAGLEHSAARLLPPGSLLLCTRATVGEVKIAKVPTATNQGFKSLAPNSGVSSTFLYYKVLTLKGVLASKGSGSTFLEVSKRDVAKLVLEVPATSEQVAIATALTDVDDEIDCLTTQLSKARDIKQGMMQELLTGRTRLPVREAVG